MGRPIRGCCSTFNSLVIESALDCKKEHYKWGAVSVRVELLDQYSIQEVPSLSTLTRLFEQHNLVQVYERHSPLPIKNMTKAEKPHDLWQMDDMGAAMYRGIGYVGIINIKDVVSLVHTGVHLLLYKNAQQHPSTKDYVYVLRQAFALHGMPIAIQSDHGSLFCENSTKSPFPTPLHLWLCGLGVNLVFASKYRPTEQGIVERTHQTLHNQIIRTTPYNDFDELLQFARKRLQRLNYDIPCATFNKPPLIHNPQAMHSMRKFYLQHEDLLFNIQRVYDFLAKATWFRKISSSHTFSLGNEVYYLSKAIKKAQIRITFCPKTLFLNCYNDKELIGSVPIKKLNYSDIIANF